MNTLDRRQWLASVAATVALFVVGEPVQARAAVENNRIIVRVRGRYSDIKSGFRVSGSLLDHGGILKGDFYCQECHVTNGDTEMVFAPCNQTARKALLGAIQIGPSETREERKERDAKTMQEWNSLKESERQEIITDERRRQERKRKQA